MEAAWRENNLNYPDCNYVVSFLDAMYYLLLYRNCDIIVVTVIWMLPGNMCTFLLRQKK